MQALSAHIWKQRSQFLKSTRDFFYARDFVETDTPCLIDHLCAEPYLDPYTVELENGKKAYLITSPEFGLKKVLSSGLDHIFEIAHAFRSYEKGELHRREFLMLEWYSRPSELEDMMNETESLVRHLAPQSPAQAFERIDLEDWFKQHYAHGLDKEDLLKSVNQLRGEDSSDWTLDDLFYRLFLPTEHELKNRQVFFYNYPAHQALYSKIKNNRARRFELYLNGVEVANCYEEETNSSILQSRIDEANILRKIQGKELAKTDEAFLKALEHNSLPLSGTALGLDRLFAYAQAQSSLQNICPYTQSRF